MFIMTRNRVENEQAAKGTTTNYFSLIFILFHLFVWDPSTALGQHAYAVYGSQKGCQEEEERENGEIHTHYFLLLN